MAAYSISVSKDGNLLFRTQEQPGSSADEQVEKVILEISSRFKRELGYKVELIEWPDQIGHIADVTQ